MEYLTKEAVAKMFAVHPRTVERWLQKGLLHGHKLGEGRTALWRISQDELDKFLKKHRS